MARQPGTRLGPYDVLSALGAGGMGEVDKARETRLDRTVAIKILPDTLAADAQFREREDNPKISAWAPIDAGPTEA